MLDSCTAHALTCPSFRTTSPHNDSESVVLSGHTHKTSSVFERKGSRQLKEEIFLLDRLK